MLAYRELDEALNLTASAEDWLNDWRSEQNTQYSMTSMLRQSLYSRLAGYEVKIGWDHDGGSETQVFLIRKWLASPCDGRIIANRPEKLNLRHEHQLKWEIPV